MVLPSLFHHSFGLYAVLVNLVAVLTPGFAAAVSSSSQSYLGQQALNDILGRAAPIAGKISLHFSLRGFMAHSNQSRHLGPRLLTEN